MRCKNCNSKMIVLFKGIYLCEKCTPLNREILKTLKIEIQGREFKQRKKMRRGETQ